MNQPDKPKGWYSRGYLPHFDGGEIPQFLTIRLYDAVPAQVIHRWQWELERQESDEGVRASILRDRIETYLDQGYGHCWLKHPPVARMVEQALLHLDAQRYRLHAWVVMPNHAHFLFTPLSGNPLSNLMHSLKSWTAKEANRILQREGRFWMPDYFDRYIRDAKHFGDVFDYIENNPVKAGLCRQPLDWPYSSARQRL